LDELLPASSWKSSPDFFDEMRRIAKVARADLHERGRKEYLFLFEGIGWCGTAGCKLLIGEVWDDGRCHLLYDGDGDYVTVLRRRDHGYRRLYTPCEQRFDGKMYQQLHPDCPSLDVQR
jgi:hypothetical protein